MVVGGSGGNYNSSESKKKKERKKSEIRTKNKGLVWEMKRGEVKRRGIGIGGDTERNEGC